MAEDKDQYELKHIAVDVIDRNPDNPRVLFRAKELNELQESIRRFGIQVPVSVYRKGRRYVLIDGERRWRSALKLNLSHIPAMVQEDPGALKNLLLMFNIHALREQWDLLTIALKLPRVVELFEDEHGREPNERELAEQTGLTRGLIRRCRLLMDLPKKYQGMILEELTKPKEVQRLTEDFFIEMERALKTVGRALPEAIGGKNAVRDVLIQKYQDGVIRNIMEFRSLSKIGRAQNVQVDPRLAKEELGKVFSKNDYSIKAAYEASVSAAYSERGLLTKISSLQEQLDELQGDDEIDDDVVAALRKLSRSIKTLLERGS